MSQAEHPDRTTPQHTVTVEDVRQLMGASTPHFALQLRARIRALIKGLAPERPARREGLTPLPSLSGDEPAARAD
jgi:hypothetical protein